MSISPYADAPKDKLDEIIRLAEVRLSAQLTLGVAADQRAMTFASFLAAVEGAVITGLVAVKANHAVPVSLVVMVVGFAFAAVLALIAAQPVSWDIVGARPGSWVEDIKDKDPLHNGRAAMADYYDQMIFDNDMTLKGNADLLRSAIFIVVITLMLAGVFSVTVG